jgi:general secretion pathway protein A
LDSREAVEYVRERLMIAGHPTGEIFAGAALRAVHRLSGGIPRIINVICDNALLTAFSKRAAKVSAQMVLEAAADLGLEAVAAQGPREVAPPVEIEAKRRGLLRRLWFRWPVTDRIRSVGTEVR